MHHSHNLVPEGVNLSHKLMRLQARPKILLCRTFEEAWDLFETYRENILGVISDIEFPRGGELAPRAGVEFARARARSAARHPDHAAVEPPRERGAGRGGRRRLPAQGLAGAPAAAPAVHGRELRLRRLRLPAARRHRGRAARATCSTLEEMLRTVPAESLAYHGERNHFSNWLKARTEFALAHSLRPRKVSDFGDLEDLRRDLIQAIQRLPRRAGPARSSPTSTARRSTAQPASRGSAAARSAARRAASRSSTCSSTTTGSATGFPDVEHRRAAVGRPRRGRVRPVPRRERPARLRDRDATTTRRSARRFHAAALPEEIGAGPGRVPRGRSATRSPCARRACSRTRSTSRSPASTRRTCCRTTTPDRGVRLAAAPGRDQARLRLHVLAAREGVPRRATPYRLEEEKMAVILQRVVGGGARRPLLPAISPAWRGRTTSIPSPPIRTPRTASRRSRSASAKRSWTARPASGSARDIPRHLVQFSSVKDSLQNSQREFYALQLDEPQRAAAPVPRV